MTLDRAQFEKIASWIEAGTPVVLVRVAGVRGSAPRNADAAMSVTLDGMAGTIGGGQLEWLALGHARDMLNDQREAAETDIPLGPEIGQCCGGHVKLFFERLDKSGLAALEREARSTEAEMPSVYVFGAGHTGKALATALAPLPVHARLVDSRSDVFGDYDAPVEPVTSPLPEALVREAPTGSAFVTMTHDHSLDFLITAEALDADDDWRLIAEALKRGDAAYVGMIGSATKRAVFLNWLDRNDYGRELGEKLTCPIGGSAVKDKRPEVIAALTAAEILGALAK